MSIRSTGQVCDTLKTNAHPNFVVSIGSFLCRFFVHIDRHKVTPIIILTLDLSSQGLDRMEQQGELET